MLKNPNLQGVYNAPFKNPNLEWCVIRTLVYPLLRYNKQKPVIHILYAPWNHKGNHQDKFVL